MKILYQGTLAGRDAVPLCWLLPSLLLCKRVMPLVACGWNLNVQPMHGPCCAVSKFRCLISGGMRFVSKEAVCKQGDESDMEDGDGSDGDDEDDEDAESGDDEGAQLIPPRSAKHCGCLWSSATGLSCLMLGD